MKGNIRTYLSSRINLYFLVIFLIIFFGALLRIYALFHNWSIGNDDARDVIIASAALGKGEFPLIGPFSSAGPFVTGPIYYWFLMAGLAVLPFGLVSSWILLLILSIANIAVFIYIGYLLRGKRLSILLGLFSAASFLLISLSLNLTNPTFILLITSLLILFFILFIQKKKVIYAFICGLIIGIALNMHYQAINLLIFIPFLLLVSGITWKRKILALILSISGLIIPLLPILWWDSHQNFSNINNILDYLLIAQYRIYVPNSWKIFIFTDMTQLWGDIIGGSKIFGLLSMFIVGLTSLLIVVRFKKIKKLQAVYLLPVMFFIMLFVNRFYHAQRSEVYLLYLCPFVLLSVAMSFDLLLDRRIFSKNKFITYGIYLVILMLMIGNLFMITSYFIKYKGNTATFTKSAEYLKTKYPNTKFSLYDRHGSSTSISLPLSLILSRQNLESSEGRKIAVDCIPSKVCKYGVKPIGFVGGFPLAEISTFSAKELKKEYQNVDATVVYDSLIGWSHKYALTHTFYLKDYILEKF